MNRNRLAFYVRRAIYIFIAWVVFAVGVFMYDYITLVSNNALTSKYDFISSFTAYLVVAICAGLTGGIFTVNLMEYWLRKYRFWVALLLIVFVYTVVAVLLGSLGALYLNGPEEGLPLFRQEAILELPLFFSEALFLKNYVIWLILLVLTLIFLMVSERFGPGVFPNYLKGKYFQPKKESRIFMFSDIKGATPIAEAMGEEKYFYFLKDFFKFISPAITEFKGEIYQYVGDEIVISWKLKKTKKRKDRSPNLKSLCCYYSMKKLIEKRADYFQETYGVVPEFKSGFHCGTAVVGEIGVIKRDIAFSGDVLNTAARIQSKCNELGVGILASESYRACIEPIPSKYEVLPQGNQALKGKQTEVSLVSFRNKN